MSFILTFILIFAISIIFIMLFLMFIKSSRNDDIYMPTPIEAKKEKGSVAKKEKTSEVINRIEEKYKKKSCISVGDIDFYFVFRVTFYFFISFVIISLFSSFILGIVSVVFSIPILITEGY